MLTNVLAQASGETQAESVLHEVASWWLLICGIIYTAAVSHLSGFACALYMRVVVGFHICILHSSPRSLCSLSVGLQC